MTCEAPRTIEYEPMSEGSIYYVGLNKVTNVLRAYENPDSILYRNTSLRWAANDGMALITAIKDLKSIKAPALFISTYDVCDEKLNKMFTFDMKFDEPLRLQDTLLYRAPSACNMVFNHALREQINKSTPEYVRMHDFWTLIVALSHNYQIITRDVPLIKYRQHAGESVGITPTAMTRLKRLIHSSSKGNNERWRQAKEAYDFYGKELPADKNDILKSVVEYRVSFRNRVKLLKDKRFKTSSTYINILFKASVLVGKF